MQGACNRSSLYRLKRLSNIICTPNLLDVLQSSFDNTTLKKITPFFSPASRALIKSAIFIWMQFCVLEDKLTRLVSFHKSGDIASLQAELEVYRVWSVQHYPRWLAFEVESRIQIRPIQYSIARTLIENPFRITQLNMGLGKTRVILPMIIMHFIDKTDKILRINLLSPLFEEGVAYFHSYLSGTVQSIRFMRLPFNRDVQLDENRVIVMKSVIYSALKHNKYVKIRVEKSEKKTMRMRTRGFFPLFFSNFLVLSSFLLNTGIHFTSKRLNSSKRIQYYTSF